MFEKEAEIYALSNFGFRGKNRQRVLTAKIDYQYGAEYGYNKANEWHYVKDEFPKDSEYVLIYTDLNNCYVAKKVENHFMSKGWGFIPMSTVIAWKEIVLPEQMELLKGVSN